MLPPEAGGPDPVALADDVAAFLEWMSPVGRAGIVGGALALDAAAVLLARRRLASLDVAGRERVLAAVTSNAEVGAALDALKAAVTLVGGANRYAADLLERSNREPPARPDADLDVTPSAEWPSVATCDVVVIGSGAGGAMAARTLARAGLDVVVVEEGRRFTVDEFRTRHPAERFGMLYRDGGATVAIGRPPVVLPIGRGVGGTTLVNSGTCYRPPGAVLRRWRDDAGLALADPDRLTPFVDDVWATLQVAPVPLDIMGANGRTMLAGADALGWAAGPLHRNAPGCGGCCQCAIGCPRNAKFGVHLNALPDACAAGTRIVSDLRVSRILHERGRATGVLARRPDGTGVELRAERVVVAAGATETPPLLRRSGLGRHRHVGRNLALHPALAAAGRFDEPVVSWQGVLQSAAVEQFHHDEGILIEATATPPGMGSMALPGYGRRLVEEIDGADRLVNLGAMIGDEPSGRVLGSHRRASVLTYDVTRRDAGKLMRALGHMGRVLFAAGAREVLTGVPWSPTVASVEELDDLIATTDIRAMHLAAFHPTGSVRAGADPERYPVDPEGRLRGIEGVWVADASILPSCPEVNPQVTIMALAQSVASVMV
jgi:choline dehydrogenase-like flavoprotein